MRQSKAMKKVLLRILTLGHSGPMYVSNGSYPAYLASRRAGQLPEVEPTKYHKSGRSGSFRPVSGVVPPWQGSVQMGAHTHYRKLTILMAVEIQTKAKTAY